MQNGLEKRRLGRGLPLCLCAPLRLRRVFERTQKTARKDAAGRHTLTIFLPSSASDEAMDTLTAALDASIEAAYQAAMRGCAADEGGEDDGKARENAERSG